MSKPCRIAIALRSLHSSSETWCEYVDDITISPRDYIPVRRTAVRRDSSKDARYRAIFTQTVCTTAGICGTEYITLGGDCCWDYKRCWWNVSACQITHRLSGGKAITMAIRMALRNLYTGMDACDYAYQEAMQRIETQSDGQKMMAKRVMSWITCARRQLKVVELQHALAVGTGELRFDSENLPDPVDMLSICAGLVTLDEHDAFIQLVHYTTQEYFERTWGHWFPRAHEDIAATCITYLSFDAFGSGICPTEQAFRLRLRDYPLYSYAAHNWGHHARVQQVDHELVSKLLNNPSKVAACVQGLLVKVKHFRHFSYLNQIKKELRTLRLIAYFGLGEQINLVETGAKADAKETDGRTPLLWAAGNGHLTVVELLLTMDVDMDTRDLVHGQTPLSLAAENGHDDIVQLLLQRKATPDSRSSFGRTPLSWAAEDGHDAVVKLFLDSDVDPDSRDEFGRTPLLHAAANGHDKVIKLLLDGGADPYARDTQDGRSALSWAAENGHAGVVEALLRYDADVHSADADNERPMYLAANNDHEAIVRMLLEKSISQGLTVEDGQIALFFAASKGHESILKLLVDTPIDLNARNNVDVPALCYAALLGHGAIVRILLENGVQTNVSDKYKHSALALAAGNGHEDIVKQPLNAHTQVNSQDSEDWTPLMWAAYEGHEPIVKLLIDAAADTNLYEQTGRTALFRAAERGFESTVKHLLDAGSDPDRRDGCGHTALMWAAAIGRDTVVALLCSRYADVTIKDRAGRTALHAAAGNGQLQVVNTLLLTGQVDADLKDVFGRSALSVAMKRGEEDIIQALQQKGDTRDETKITKRSVAKVRLRCDVCLQPIPDKEFSYHCDKCSGGDFDMCQECFDCGGFCLDQSHKLAKRVLQSTAFVECT